MAYVDNSSLSQRSTHHLRTTRSGTRKSPATGCESLNIETSSPPNDADLSDAWVVAIVQSDLTGKERNNWYPRVFASKYLASTFQNKGRPAKIFDDDTTNRHYRIAFGHYQSLDRRSESRVEESI